VNPINHFKLNRPVHLARRDVYFEKAVELLAEHRQTPDGSLSIESYEEILFMLRTARDHAEFAIRGADLADGHDRQFRLFINLLVGNVKSVLSMINLKGMIENSQGSSYSFLGVNQASAALQAEEYQRRANDVVRSMQNTVRLAQEPFENLKAENRETATHEENLRYKRARDHHLQLAGKERNTGRIPSLFRRFMRA
jgi:hypothetical protein